MPSDMQCDGCAHCVSYYVRVDERGGYWEEDCDLVNNHDVWTDEELDAMERGECPHFVPRKTDQ